MATTDGFNNPKPSVLFQQTSKDILAPTTKKEKSFKVQVPKGAAKKTLVRNTEVAIHPTIYKSDLPVDHVREDSNVKPSTSSGLYKTNLSAPCLNSALRLVKEMKQTSQAKPSKNQCAKLLDEGKVLQQVNFLYEEHLYHDLVALNVSDVDVEACSARHTSKFHARQKDKEPQLSQFFTPSFSEEYRIPRQPPHRTLKPQGSSQSFSVYQRMRSWEAD